MDSVLKFFPIVPSRGPSADRAMGKVLFSFGDFAGQKWQLSEKTGSFLCIFSKENANRACFADLLTEAC